MFSNPELTAQLTADRRFGHTAAAAHHRAARRGFDEFAAELGERVAADGVDGAAREIDAVVRLARRRCVGSSLAAIVADRAQPVVARERALGRLLATLASPAPASSRGARPAA